MNRDSQACCFATPDLQMEPLLITEVFLLFIIKFDLNLFCHKQIDLILLAQSESAQQFRT